ncbi:MAG: thioredoxin-dependent peroxiredoxin [Verrucomicrobiota bacterium]|jgi:peroxiredoxin Q/BCP
MAGEIKIGDTAPHFRIMAVGGKYRGGQEVGLTDFLGEPLVLYFYPKDDTPGCTVQACGLRDAWNEVKASATVFGVSTDPVKSHARFIKKFRLPFPLLADSEKKMVNAYGVWVGKNFLGKKYMGTERTTFVIDRDGRISAIFRKVKPGEHVDLIRSALNQGEK